MPQCTTPLCNNSWEPPDGPFPTCLIAPCPLRQLQHDTVEQSTGQNLFQNQINTQTHTVTSRVATQVAQSLNSLRNDCEVEFKPYNMQGAKSATTKVTLPGPIVREFKTTDQMHSEMRAIEKMIEEGHWSVYLGHVVWASDNSSVKLEQFSTTEPHCGFCTIFLIAAGLPLGKPTRGNHQLAGRLSYQLPYELETSPHFMARVLDGGCYCGFPALKRVLNAFINVPAKEWLLGIGGAAYVNDVSYTKHDKNLLVVDWFDLVEMHKREVIYLAWKVIYEQILLTNKSQK